MATQQLGRWASSLDYLSLPQPVIEAAIRSFQNSLGSILGGSNHPTTQRTIKALQPLFGDRKCTIIGHAELSGSAVSCDLQHAALINGIASHVHDYDDTHLHTVIHPAGAVVVSLLALAEYLKLEEGRIVSGKDFITALVAGIEIGLRIGNAVSPKHYDEGWHITGTVSPMAVAAASSNLLRLTPEQTANAISIASTQPVGVRVHFGTDTKPFHVGRAAQNGILAAMLAKGGFTAAPDALEGRRGWVEVLGNGSNTLSEQVNQLLQLSEKSQSSAVGREIWEIEKNTFKPFPCGIVIHPTIDACVQLHKEHDLQNIKDLDKIDSVHLRVHPLVLDLTGKKSPKDGLEAKFSVYHGAAIGLALGSATPAEYEDNIVNDKRVLTVRAKVTAEVDETVHSDEAIVTLTMQGGVRNEKHVEHAVGSLDRPMTNEELHEKFMSQAIPVLGKERATEVESMAWEICDVRDVARLAKAAR
ncbi:hypothetical protein PMZ80_005963 [Knufia obscura]|nr:hypothetical protein PMZ80_005963 [Knufia obscura]